MIRIFKVGSGGMTSRHTNTKTLASLTLGCWTARKTPSLICLRRDRDRLTRRDSQLKYLKSGKIFSTTRTVIEASLLVPQKS